ncbi:Uncharacterised protein [Bordetella pertussis]|nr:Uncharacterised protein [Bordetella pertussis]CFL73988.1 Uncharacterised protein [Bordetella pertussis]CFL79330.1 Uncharacterised protein [Bordetella pertussis]CFL89092.1 Uncharacterised protein [Bordetella pertussis]CFL97459.1 Uncharacterised protein [Bordetella pertussis]
MARGQLVEQKARQRHGFAQAGTKRFGAQLSHIRVRIVLGRQEQEADGDIVAQHRQAGLQGPPGGTPAGGVAVEAENHLVAGAQQLLHMVGRGRRAQRGHRVGDALQRQPHDVHVALDHHDLALLAYGQASLPQAIEFMALGKQRGLGRVEVFGLALADDAPAKADQAAARIADGKHHAFAEAVVAPPVLRLDHQAGFHQHGILVVVEHMGQAMAVGARPAQPEMGGDLAGQPALLEVGNGLRRAAQLAQVVRLRGVEHLRMARHLGLAAGRFGLLARTVVFFGNREPHGGRQRAYGLGETRARMLHQEGDGTAVGAATETVIELLGRTDSERRAFFVVKRAKTKQVGPTLAQLHISPDDVNDVDPGEQILDE